MTCFLEITISFQVAEFDQGVLLVSVAGKWLRREALRLVYDNIVSTSLEQSHIFLWEASFHSSCRFSAPNT